jgi:hypothetical protein
MAEGSSILLQVRFYKVVDRHVVTPLFSRAFQKNERGRAASAGKPSPQQENQNEALNCFPYHRHRLNSFLPGK